MREPLLSVIKDLISRAGEAPLPVIAMTDEEIDGSRILPDGHIQVPLLAQTAGSASGSWSTIAQQHTLCGSGAENHRRGQRDPVEA